MEKKERQKVLIEIIEITKNNRMKIISELFTTFDISLKTRK